MADRGPARLVLSRRGYSAITFGHVVISAGQPSSAMWEHEREHVAQYERLGCAFLPVYVIEYLRHGYAAHPLERAASAPTRLSAG